MYHDDGHQLYMPQDVRLCSVCRNWVELSEFRKRTGGGIAPECRECHNSIRAAQRRRQRARRGTQALRQAIADINIASHPPDLHAAATAILGVCGGLRGFAKHYAAQFNATAEGSQMRTSMLLAGMRLITQYAKELDATAVKPENMSDEELAAHLSAACK
ncbi:hypothetical protein OAE40_00620 [Rubripirellula sp.]|nr:hypothetical protein [Rubripirellula sp.]MDB4654258.1 hypothetical protein [Rubripirellula sp.]